MAKDYVEELGRTTVPVIGNLIIVYDHWDGQKGDPASKQERRMAMFMPEHEVPREDESLQDWVDVERDKYKDPYRNKRNRHSYSYSWDGLYGAAFDEALETIKEKDKDAEKFRQEMESAMAPVKRYYYDDDDKATTSDAEKFFDAVDRIAEDREDQDAWKIIEAYRERQRSRSESGAKQL